MLELEHTGDSWLTFLLGILEGIAMQGIWLSGVTQES